MSRIASLLAPGAHLLDLAGPAQVLSTAVGFGHPCTLRCLAEQAHVPTAQGLPLAAQLVWLRLGGVSFVVRRAIASHPDLSPAERNALATDPDPGMRLAVPVHPAWSEEERAGIDYAVPLDGLLLFCPEPLTPPDPEAVRRDALSGHPMLRRNAARVHTLPADLVARLAVDDDPGVRVLLAQNHPDAPAALLLRRFL